MISSDEGRTGLRVAEGKIEMDVRGKIGRHGDPIEFLGESRSWSNHLSSLPPLFNLLS